MFSVSITHNSKIRELSDGNWITDHESWSPNKWSSVDPTNFGSWVMKTGWYHSKLSSSKQALTFFIIILRFQFSFFSFQQNKLYPNGYLDFFIFTPNNLFVTKIKKKKKMDIWWKIRLQLKSNLESNYIWTLWFLYSIIILAQN